MRKSRFNFAAYSDADMGRLGELLGLTHQELSLVRLRAAGFSNADILRQSGIHLQKLADLEAAVEEKVLAYQEALADPDEDWSEAQEAFEEGKDVPRHSRAKRGSKVTVHK